MIRGERCKADAKSKMQQFQPLAISLARHVLHWAAILAAFRHSFYIAAVHWGLDPQLDGNR